MFRDILSNTYAQAAAFLAVPVAFGADYIGKEWAYLAAFAFVILLFVLAYLDEWKKKKLYSQPNIPIPIVFNITNPAHSKSALDAIFEKLNHTYPNHQKNLEKYFNILPSDLIFKYDGDIFDDKRFIDFLKVTKHDIKRLEAKTPQNIHFHIVYIGPIANAVLVGTMLGTEGITLYQYNKSSDSYTISLEINSRTYKEHINEFKIVKKEIIGELEGAKDITIAIDMASHKVALGKLKKPIIHLQSTVGATIHEAKDFIRANQEIYSVINELQQQSPHIILAYSMPTSVAILLGMSVQNYWDIELTQFSDGEYKTVIKHLDEIKYYF